MKSFVFILSLLISGAAFASTGSAHTSSGSEPCIYKQLEQLSMQDSTAEPDAISFGGCEFEDGVCKKVKPNDHRRPKNRKGDKTTV